MRPGNYSAVREQQMQEHDASLHARDAARSEYRRLAQEQQRRREEVDRSAAKRSRRNLDPHDHDSREKIGRAIVSGKDRKAADKVRQLDQRFGLRLVVAPQPATVRHDTSDPPNAVPGRVREGDQLQAVFPFIGHPSQKMTNPTANWQLINQEKIRK